MPTCPKVWYLASEWVRQGAAMAYNDFQTQPDCPAMPIWVNGEHAQQIFWLPWKACEMSLHPMLEKSSQFSLLLHIQKPWFPWTFLEPGPRATSSLPGLPGRRTTTRQWDPWTSEIFLALRYELGAHGFKQVYNISHDGSMVLLYMVLHESHQYTPVMLAFFYQHQPDPSWVYVPGGEIPTGKLRNFNKCLN